MICSIISHRSGLRMMANCISGVFRLLAKIYYKVHMSFFDDTVKIRGSGRELVEPFISVVTASLQNPSSSFPWYFKTSFICQMLP